MRPITAVSKSLTVMHNTLPTSLAGLSLDPFVTGSMNWVTRRCASRMCAQALNHQHWAGIQALSFFAYWVARPVFIYIVSRRFPLFCVSAIHISFILIGKLIDDVLATGRTRTASSNLRGRNIGPLARPHTGKMEPPIEPPGQLSHRLG